MYKLRISCIRELHACVKYSHTRLRGHRVVRETDVLGRYYCSFRWFFFKIFLPFLRVRMVVYTVVVVVVVV